MDLSVRLKTAAGAALKHLALSCVLAMAAAALVFGAWYPFPYRDISGGASLFALLICVDVAIGPLLTLVAFDRRKTRAHLFRDLGVIFVLQLAALCYGMWTMFEARPVWLALEGDRFRVVSAAELDMTTLVEASPDFQRLSVTGPRLIGARLAKNTDRDYLDSLKLSMGGLHPALRPSRWVPYDTQREGVRSELKPLDVLRQKRPQDAQAIDNAVRDAGLPIERLGYLPLHSRTHSDWIVVLDRQAAQPVAFAHVDGW